MFKKYTNTETRICSQQFALFCYLINKHCDDVLLFCLFALKILLTLYVWNLWIDGWLRGDKKIKNLLIDNNENK